MGGRTLRQVHQLRARVGELEDDNKILRTTADNRCGGPWL
jgi:hypothetical protein